jgi:hypothetical protein
MKDDVTIPIVLKTPSGFLPIAMSLAALTFVLVYLALFGVIHEPDEGTAAHVWQLLMAGQAPVVVFFMVRWLPRAPRPVLWVLALQVTAALVAVAPVWWLRL